MVLLFIFIKLSPSCLSHLFLIYSRGAFYDLSARLRFCIPLFFTAVRARSSQLKCDEVPLPFHAEWDIKEKWDNINIFVCAVLNVTDFPTVKIWMIFFCSSNNNNKAKFMSCNFFCSFAFCGGFCYNWRNANERKITTKPNNWMREGERE